MKANPWEGKKREEREKGNKEGIGNQGEQRE